MATKFSFDGTDLASLEIYLVRGWSRPILPGTRDILLDVLSKDGVYDMGMTFGGRVFNLECRMVAGSHVQVLSRLQSLAALVNPQPGLKELIFDDQMDRYYMARYVGSLDVKVSPLSAVFTLPFFAPSPFAYSTTLTESPHVIDADPKTVTETVGGTAPVRPIWELEPTDAIVDSLVKLENISSGEEIQWTGSLNGAGDVLKIDSNLWLVYKNDVEDMASVTGQFPRLLANAANSIKVTGVTNGGLDITYRDRYL